MPAARQSSRTTPTTAPASSTGQRLRAGLLLAFGAGESSARPRRGLGSGEAGRSSGAVWGGGGGGTSAAGGLGTCDSGEGVGGGTEVAVGGSSDPGTRITV